MWGGQVATPHIQRLLTNNTRYQQIANTDAKKIANRSMDDLSCQRYEKKTEKVGEKVEEELGGL
jgi:hypothetical protein